MHITLKQCLHVHLDTPSIYTLDAYKMHLDALYFLSFKSNDYLLMDLIHISCGFIVITCPFSFRAECCFIEFVRTENGILGISHINNEALK